MRKIFLKTLTLMLSAAVLFSLAAPARARQTFSDIGGWYAEYVTDLSERGVVNGYPDGTFRPGNSVTVGETLKLIMLAAGRAPDEASGEHWADGYRSAAVAAGYIDGRAADDLDAPADRLTVARCAAKALKLRASGAESPFADIDDGYVTVLWQKGVITGEEAGDELVFRPDSPITRAEICAVVWRTIHADIHNGQFLFQGRWIDSNSPEYALDASDFSRDEKGTIRYAGETREVLYGVDVSRYQEEIDWEKVAADGIDFAMIRLGFRGYAVSSLNTDAWYERNYDSASAAGLRVGVYFFSQAVSEEEALEEAEFVLEQLGDRAPEWVVFDWETVDSPSARTNSVEVRTLCRCAQVFCRRIAQTGLTPMIYFNKHDGYLRYDLSVLTEYDFWYAEYAEAPDFGYDFLMWQYTSSGTVEGINGRADMNILIRR